jgi:murein DD-endopeptidase MepM/ murein hydrolase activator NlpD
MDTGQLLGRVGNTGESGAPYLHFHISDGPAPLASNGLPFVITRFSWSGTVTNLDDFLTGTAPASVRARPAATWPRRGRRPYRRPSWTSWVHRPGAEIALDTTGRRSRARVGAAVNPGG